MNYILFQPMWVYNDETDSMVQRDITFVPGLYKIFDEILGKLQKFMGEKKSIALCHIAYPNHKGAYQPAHDGSL